MFPKPKKLQQHFEMPTLSWQWEEGKQLQQHFETLMSPWQCEEGKLLKAQTELGGPTGFSQNLGDFLLSLVFSWAVGLEIGYYYYLSSPHQRPVVVWTRVASLFALICPYDVDDVDDGVYGAAMVQE
jgi:hypothetical protein